MDRTHELPSRPGGSEGRTDLVWDLGHTGTVTSPGGHELRIGEGGEWTVEHLFSVALQAALMTTFVELAEAEGLEILGYVSEGEVAPGESRAFRLSPCIVVASESDGQLARILLQRAAEHSPICRMLGDHWQLIPHVVTTRSARG